MAEIVLEAKKREVSTKGAVNQLRRDGFVPGVFYIKDQDPILISVEENDINPLVFTSETHIVDLKVDDNEPLKCIVKAIQFDPLTDKVIHFDLLGLTVGEELELQVPVNFIGTMKGVKNGGQPVYSLHKIAVSCLPRDIPQHLEIDVSDLDIGDSIHVRDLKYDNISLISSEDSLVVYCAAPRTEEELEATAPDELTVEDESAEPEVIKKGKADESEEED
ncbi:MAG: 50S ribosomal protein L25 [Melioribacteraceae bacterium]|nr:50S ribosomal protein L25 [Melioribacteraceae bacterium]MCF8354949.1 50S ribosomal protein L25 [Melioribacteraceae bacterium]MCF8392362.1 50S ribosomal protein L25 [Melioribacteraceae bacterium]MCF8417882.1 50S ribosomal protein L25 [Melioribacteraceae bacterium]